MKANTKRELTAGAALLAAFALWTALVQIVDVRPVGQNGTDLRPARRARSPAAVHAGVRRRREPARSSGSPLAVWCRALNATCELPEEKRWIEVVSKEAISSALGVVARNPCEGIVAFGVTACRGK